VVGVALGTRLLERSLDVAEWYWEL